jgi:hypothetical protein
MQRRCSKPEIESDSASDARAGSADVLEMKSEVMLSKVNLVFSAVKSCSGRWESSEVKSSGKARLEGHSLANLMMNNFQYNF